MNSFQSEIMANFGVQLRRPHGNSKFQEAEMERYEERPFVTAKQRMLPQDPGLVDSAMFSRSPLVSHLHWDRCMYLPPNPKVQGNQRHSYHIDQTNSDLVGANNWQFGNMYQNFQPGTPGRPLFKQAKGFKGATEGGGGGIRRAQSFSPGSRPQSLLVGDDSPGLLTPLQLQKARNLSASQTSLVATGLSRLGGKINKVFSVVQRHRKKETDTLMGDRKKRKLPDVNKLNTESPENIFNKLYSNKGGFHGLTDRPQPYSDLVLRNLINQNCGEDNHLKQSRRQLPSFVDREEDLPDLISHERSSSAFPPMSPDDKVSRRAIVTKSRKGIPNKDFTVDDQWFSKEKLYKDHIREVLEKWDNIEDEIWAKVIILERNRRVAKAYARAPVLTINGSEDGFDGFKIGVNGFDNPLRDHKVKEFKAQIGAGCKLKMGDNGDILVKRIGKGNIYIKNILEETAVSNDILKLPSGLLELDRALKLFDMKKFKQNMNREIKRQYPDRKKIETQCIATIAFVKNEGEVLDSPVWVMIINIVALEMLAAKIPISKETGQQQGGTQKRTVGGSSDEDPYSLTASGSSKSSGNLYKGRQENNVSTDSGHASLPPKSWGNKVRGAREDNISDEYAEAGWGGEKSRRDRSTGSPGYYSGYTARVTNFQQENQNRSRTRVRVFPSPERNSDPTWLHDSGNSRSQAEHSRIGQYQWH